MTPFGDRRWTTAFLEDEDFMAEREEEGNIDDADGYNHMTGEVIVECEEYCDSTQLQPSQVELLGAYRGVRFSCCLNGLAVSVRMVLEDMTVGGERVLRVLATASKDPVPEAAAGVAPSWQTHHGSDHHHFQGFNGHLWRSAKEKGLAEGRGSLP